MIALRHRRARGFTLIELLIAMTVMLIGLLGIWRLHSATMLADANAHRLGLATSLAHDSLEKLMTEPWLSNYVNQDLDPSAGPCGGTFPANSVDGLEPLPCAVDAGAAFVNGLGSVDESLGPAMFLRTYHVDWVAGSDDRIVISVRVTYLDNATDKRHGVTLASTRTVDRYDPLGLGGESG